MVKIDQMKMESGDRSMLWQRWTNTYTDLYVYPSKRESHAMKSTVDTPDGLRLALEGVEEIGGTSDGGREG